MAESSNLNYLYTIGGYATLIGVGYVVYHVSTQKGRKRVNPTKSTKPSQSEPRKEDRKKKQRMESFASDSQESSSRPQIAKAKSAAAEPDSWASSVQTFDTSDDGVDNREFAKQFAKAREGAKLAKNTETGKQREKSVKQSRASQMGGLPNVQMSPPSSTTGADADDDQSPVASPVAAPADAAGVADMLEPATPGPSILRLIDTGSKTQKPQVAKAPQPTETKKQRQNKKKAEAAKAVREEDEKERKVMEEKQRRAARVAEGRAAKDGSQFMAVNGNTSAWKQGVPNGNSSKAPDSSALYQPLDTFEKAPAATKANTASQEAKKEAPAEGKWMSSLPSEEEQIEMLKEEADEWNTVTTKSSKKKGPSTESGDEPTQGRLAAQPKQAVTGSSKSTQAASSKTYGSFSALSTKDEPAETAEEEWDV